MNTLIIAVAAFVGYIIAYNTYGRYLGKRIFRLKADNPVPSRTKEDGTDFVPTNRHVLFGHHFTSIAGTGPIVGPAIAVMWGWLPALLWVFFGSILIGAVHDMTALVLSVRHNGQTIGDLAGKVISPFARFLFLTVLMFTLMLVIGVFGLVIATIFSIYPESVFPVWVAMPVAVTVGFWVYRRKANLLIPSLGALAILYLAIIVGCYWLPISLPTVHETFGTPVIIWTVLLLVYCFIASVLPVWVLLQPRDYINSHSLFVALALIVAGLVVASISGQADLFESAPAIVATADLPTDAPPLWPFLFITVACGAISGFHSLVGSGTSSKQLGRETDALMVGYGAMLLEGVLAIIVILACCAGIGMGVKVTPEDLAQKNITASGTVAPSVSDQTVITLTGREAWDSRYGGNWSDMNLGAKVGAFVDGGANFIAAIGIPLKLAIGIMAVLVASFAAPTLDTATRLQRYVIQEWTTTVRLRPLSNKYVATTIAVLTGGVMAMLPNAAGVYGKGGLILWPLFGTMNQIIAGLALMVGVFYLLQNKTRSTLLAIPMCIMLILPAWALLDNLLNSESGWLYNGKPLLATIGIVVLTCELLLIIEGWRIVQRMIIGPKDDKTSGE